MNRHYKDQHVVSSSAPDNPIFICASNERGKDLFHFNSNMMNVANSTGYRIHISFSKSTGELTVREVLSDQTVQTQRAVSGHLTLVGGSYLVDRFGPSLAKGALEAFFIRITLRGTLGTADLHFDNAKWDKEVREQLRLHKHRSSFKDTKVLKIWIANLPSNPTFDEDVVRGALRHGGALPVKPETMVCSSGYKDPDAVAKGNILESLDYGEPLKPQKIVTEKQPVWFDFGQGSIDPSEMEQSTAQSSGSGFGASEPANWKISRLSELEDRLRVQTVAREAVESINSGLRQTIEQQDAITREARNDVFRLRNLLRSRDLMLSIYNKEYIAHAQPDISALATALAVEKGIRRGDRQAIEAGIPSVYVGQSTVDRLLKNPFFISDFFEPQKGAMQRKRGAGSEDSLAVPSDDESNIKSSGKRMRLE